MVNHPPHYTSGKIEVLDFIEDQKFGYLDGQVIKYVSRFRMKNGLEDLKKAQFYLIRLTAKEERENARPQGPKARVSNARQRVQAR